MSTLNWQRFDLELHKLGCIKFGEVTEQTYKTLANKESESMDRGLG